MKSSRDARALLGLKGRGFSRAETAAKNSTALAAEGDFSLRPIRKGLVATLLICFFALVARAALPIWIQHLVAQTAVEAAFFRQMMIPGGPVPSARPPRETRPALTELIASDPGDADLYSLRALEDERQLDFAAAEADWKKYVELATDKPSAQLALADYYHRRLQPLDEIKALAAVGQAPSPESERLTASSEQRSWHAFERIFRIINEQALPAAVSTAQYRAWIARYPREAFVYSEFFNFLLRQKDYQSATALIAQYRQAFPGDEVFPVKARALLEYGEGSVEKGLAVYEQSFQPLWPPELVKNYFDLLAETHSLRRFLDRTRAAIAADPDDLNAASRLFYYYQQQGNLPAANRALAEYRLRKESSKAAWTPGQLYVLARLMDDVHNYPEAARYYYALYTAAGSGQQAESALAGIINILLTAPEQPLRIGAGDLSMYHDIATMDPYPGFLNGILSLVLNSTSPNYQFSDEERAAVPYFHRAQAAALLPLFDQRFSTSAQRPQLHARLIEVYANYGESDAVIRSGKEFLGAFADVPERTQVSLLMADAYARKNQTADEFAIYDALLQELAAKANGVPIGTPPEGARAIPTQGACTPPGEEPEEGAEGQALPPCPATPGPRGRARAALQVGVAPQQGTAGPRSPQYAQVLDRYLSRLTAMHDIPRALAVYRREIDRNSNDPGLYDRFANYLEQNRLGEEIEQVYRRAIKQFPGTSWYDKLARWYLRHDRGSDYDALSREVTQIFSGSDLEAYLAAVPPTGAQLYLQVNLYAHQRFPHDLVFVHNLLTAYRMPQTYNPQAWQDLIRQHWMYDDQLRAEFFADLSRRGLLDAQLASLRSTDALAGAGEWPELVHANPAAAQFIADAELWQSHFEVGAPVLQALAADYPADPDLGRRASAVLRSLAAFDPRDTDAAVAIAQNLSRYDPGDRDRLAAIGDIYADRELYAKARPHWERMAQVRPGDSDGYLQAATVYWDYFLFDDALRLLQQGRAKLANPNLYSYEAGAIYEGKRDYPSAVNEYVRGALASGSESIARHRLLTLARRPAYRALVDAATAKPAAADNPIAAAVDLRVAVLQAQDRRADLEQFLSSVVGRTTSLDLLESVQNIAQQQSLVAVRQLAMERQLTLATDPVERMQLRLALMRFYEGRNQLDDARRHLEALRQDNPVILGVVRASADFYWRNKLPQEAITVLLQAAKTAYPQLRDQFILEAARKSAESAQYEPARRLLAPLLQQSPYDAGYLAAMADTYARAGDDRGLADFYLATITQFATAPMSPDERTARIAALRRALIPALTRLKQYSAAVDQYLELLNRYPEDDSLATEAALYAQRYSQQQRLVAYYAKASADSPRDFRWPMVLARIQVQLEDYPAAIEAYSRASAIRPDRADLQIARAGMEERLLRFDDAAKDDERIYALLYRDPQWMLKVAEIRARQGQTDAVVKALTTALIDNRPDRPENYFEVARRLESWGMLPQARQFAERGLDTAGDTLLNSAEHHPGVELYARIMTRLRQHTVAYERLRGLQHAAAPPPAAAVAVPGQPIAVTSEAALRREQARTRANSARDGLQRALKQMGSTADTYFTPEEKTAFAAFVEQQRAGASLADVADLLGPLAESAVLPELEVRWRDELILARFRNNPADITRLVQLQRRRMKFAELGAQLEAILNVVPRNRRAQVLTDAADSYRAAGDYTAELRILSLLRQEAILPPALRARHYELLLSQQPTQLLAVARSGRSGDERNSAANFAVANAAPDLALQAVTARGQGLPLVWSKAYTGLVGLYLLDRGPAINSAFLGALGGGTIAEHLGAKVDRTQQLAGDVWFYYGSRYGEYLGDTGQPNAEDYLPAVLEQSPGRSSAYLVTAEYYQDAGQSANAIADYDHSLELNPSQPSVQDSIALILWKDNQHDDAIARWKLALDVLARQQDRAPVPETFWRDFATVVDHLGARRLLPQLRPGVDSLLRTYIRRNGAYRSAELLHSAFRAVGDPQAAAWILDLAPLAPNQSEFLRGLVDETWIPAAQREPVYLRILDLSQEQVARSEGQEREANLETLREWQVRWIDYLVARRQTQRAQAALDALPQETRVAMQSALVPAEVRIAAQAGTLDALLNRYRADAEKAPPLEYLSNAAAGLRSAGDRAATQRVLEFVYTRQIEQHQLNSANLLGLAEIRLAQGDTAAALQSLRRLTLVVGNPFENLEPAAQLLLNSKHPAEAAEFLSEAVRAIPWDQHLRVKLAEAQVASARNAQPAQDSLRSVLASADAPYSVRIDAARGLARVKVAAGNPGSQELQLLASGSLTPAQAEQPFFFRARLSAAQPPSAPDVQLRLLLDAIALRPNEDSARVLLFRAALAAGKHQTAVAALEPLLGRSLYRSGAALQSVEVQEEADTEVAQAPGGVVVGGSFLPTIGLVAEQRAAIAAGLASALEKLGEMESAFDYYQLASRIEPAAARRTELRKTAVDVKTRLDLRARNAACQPLVHDALEQDRIVRPRVVAGAAPPKPGSGGKTP